MAARGGPGRVAGTFVGGRVSRRAYCPPPRLIQRPWKTRGAAGPRAEPADTHRREGQARLACTGWGRKGQTPEGPAPLRAPPIPASGPHTAVFPRVSFSKDTSHWVRTCPNLVSLFSYTCKDPFPQQVPLLPPGGWDSNTSLQGTQESRGGRGWGSDHPEDATAWPEVGQQRFNLFKSHILCS